MKRWGIGVAALLASLASASPANEPLKPVAFVAEARVEVDLDGKVVKVEAAKDLPASVRTFIEQQLATWKYVRNKREGMTGNAATWVSLGACAVPAPTGGYTMGLAFHGNGPRIAGGGRMPLTRELFQAASRSQASGEIKMQFVIGSDGKVTIESIDFGTMDARTRKALRPAVVSWIERVRFDPEELDGRPIPTRTRMGVAFNVGGGKGASRNVLHSAECKQAAAAGESIGPENQAVAVDSVIGIEPAI